MTRDVDSPRPRTCAACRGELRPWLWARPQEPSLRQRYLLVRCRVCGSAATAGPPDPELHEAGAYAAETPRAAGLIETVRRLCEGQKLALLRRHLPRSARIVEAGAGQGRFVLAARAAGYEASGFEPSARGIAAAARRGVELAQMTFEDAELPAASAECLVLWHVLEHLERPAAALERARAWLAPGGLLMAGVPNVGSVQAAIGGSRWLHLDVPRHRHHFTPTGMRSLLERTGFAPVSEHHLLLEHNPFGMWQTWLDRATTTPAYAYNLVKRNAPLRARDLVPTLLLAPLAPIAVIAELAAGLARRGGTIAVLARRR